MTETEKVLEERYGNELNPKAKVEDSRSLSQIFAQIKERNTYKAEKTPEITDEMVRNAFNADYQQQVNWRNRQFVATEEYNERLSMFVDWLMGGYLNDRWLYLSGDVGNGKSTSARALLSVLGRMGQKTLAKKSSEMILLYRQLDTSKQALTQWNAILAAPVLYIDDFEVGKYLDELLEWRYDNMTYTIISSNIGLSDLSNVVSARIFDRIMEMTTEIVFTEPSYRRR